MHSKSHVLCNCEAQCPSYSCATVPALWQCRGVPILCKCAVRSVSSTAFLYSPHPITMPILHIPCHCDTEALSSLSMMCRLYTTQMCHLVPILHSCAMSLVSYVVVSCVFVFVPNSFHSVWLCHTCPNRHVWAESYIAVPYGPHPECLFLVSQSCLSVLYDLHPM